VESLSGPARSRKQRLWRILVYVSLVPFLIPLRFPGASGREAAVFPEASAAPVVPGESTAPAVRTFSLTGTDTISLLLVGQDRDSQQAQGRSDAILLCTLHRSRQQMILTSFLRDLYVSIPGYEKNRINAAFAYGGAPLLSRTLEENFGVRPDGWLVVDFSGFSKIVDTLGGVALELTREEAEDINQKCSGALTQGRNLLSGREALAYVRIRKLDADGDFSRTVRQQKLLEAILEAGKSSSAATLLTLLGQILPLVETDLTTGQLLRLAPEVLSVLPQLQLQKQQIPEPDTFTYETIRGMSVLVPDLEKARKALEDTLQPQKEAQ